VSDPSAEHGGGFEFASGMDVFSEPGVMTASRAFENVTLDGGLTITTQVRCSTLHQNDSEAIRPAF